MMPPALRISLIGMGFLAIAVSAPAGVYEKGGAMGPGARGMGLAGAYSALAADETAVWWNPAGLGEVDTLRVGSSLASLYDGRIRSLDLAMATPLPAAAAAGFGWTHAFYPHAVELNEDTLALAGSLPLSRDRQLHLGAGLKFLFGRMNTAEGDYFGMGLDLGLRYQLPLTAVGERLDLGLRVQDLDTRITWHNGVSEQIPQSVVLGSALHFNADTVAVMDLEMVHSGQSEGEETRLLRMGLERSFDRIVSLRTGYLLDNHHASTFSFGAGLHVAEWDMQYALLGELANLGLSHRLTLSYGLPALPRQVATALPTAEPTPEVTVKPQPSAFQVELIAYPERFSPNNDGFSDTVILQMQVKQGDPGEIGRWRLTFTNAQGKKVDYFEGKTFTEQWEWDGSNQAGDICPDGSYTVTLELWDLEDNLRATVSKPLQLRTQLPALKLSVNPQELVIIAGRAQQPVRFAILSPDDLAALKWKLLLRTPLGKLVKTYVGQGPMSKETVWDGRMENGTPAYAGTYHAVLVVEDLVGLGMSIEQTIKVRQVDPQLLLQVKPRLLKIGDRDASQAEFSLDIKPPEKVRSWQLTIQDALTDKTVRVFNGSGDVPATVVWDAKNQKGELIPGGAYFYAQWSAVFPGGGRAESPRVALATDLPADTVRQGLALHLTAISFEAGSSTIPLEAYKRLQQAAETIKRYAKNYRVQIKGYTDSQEAPGRELELSWERAQKIREYLVVSGKISGAVMDVVGYGANLPLASEKTTAGRMKNRRVEVVLIIQK